MSDLGKRFPVQVRLTAPATPNETLWSRFVVINSILEKERRLYNVDLELVLSYAGQTVPNSRRFKKILNRYRGAWREHDNFVQSIREESFAKMDERLSIFCDTNMNRLSLTADNLEHLEEKASEFLKEVHLEWQWYFPSEYLTTVWKEWASAVLEVLFSTGKSLQEILQTDHEQVVAVKQDIECLPLDMKPTMEIEKHRERVQKRILQLSYIIKDLYEVEEEQMGDVAKVLDNIHLGENLNQLLPSSDDEDANEDLNCNDMDEEDEWIFEQ
jgi:hypothetical protein